MRACVRARVCVVKIVSGQTGKVRKRSDNTKFSLVISLREGRVSHIASRVCVCGGGRGVRTRMFKPEQPTI